MLQIGVLHWRINKNINNININKKININKSVYTYRGVNLERLIKERVYYKTCFLSKSASNIVIVILNTLFWRHTSFGA